MWIHSQFIQQTGTIIYEGDQTMISGLKNYSNVNIETGCRFSVISRSIYIRRKSDGPMRERMDKLTVHFGMKQLINLNATGVYFKNGKTRLLYDDEEFRATNVNDYGRPWDYPYLSIGLLEVIFERRMQDAY
jgi:hypothetical protein